MSGREEGREEGREQAELRRVGRAAAELRWLKRLVQDLNQVLDTAAADIDADISLLQELGACGGRGDSHVQRVLLATCDQQDDEATGHG